MFHIPRTRTQMPFLFASECLHFNLKRFLCCLWLLSFPYFQVSSGCLMLRLCTGVCTTTSTLDLKCLNVIRVVVGAALPGHPSIQQLMNWHCDGLILMSILRDRKVSSFNCHWFRVSGTLLWLKLFKGTLFTGFTGAEDALIPSYPKLEDDSEHCYRRTELELLL